MDPAWQGALRCRTRAAGASAEIDGRLNVPELPVNAQAQIGTLAPLYRPTEQKNFIVMVNFNISTGWAGLEILVDGRVLIRASTVMTSAGIHLCYALD